MIIINMNELFIKRTNDELIFKRPFEDEFKKDWAFYDGNVRVDNGWVENYNGTFSRDINTFEKLTARRLVKKGIVKYG